MLDLDRIENEILTPMDQRTIYYELLLTEQR